MANADNTDNNSIKHLRVCCLISFTQFIFPKNKLEHVIIHRFIQYSINKDELITCC